MKVKVIIDEKLTGPELVLKVPSAKAVDPSLVTQLEALKPVQTISGWQGTSEYLLAPENLLFVETAGRALQLHTADQIYASKFRLYELAEQLPENFMQVSKSALLNLDQVSALNRSLSSCLVSFRGSHKQIYASRRYYHALVARLEERRMHHDNK